LISARHSSNPLIYKRSDTASPRLSLGFRCPPTSRAAKMSHRLAKIPLR
jgi:hypothetical protein